MYPLVVDVISGRRQQPTRGEIVVLGAVARPGYVTPPATRPPPTVVVSAPAPPSVGISWLSRKANASVAEADAVVREINSRNVFGQSQAARVTTQEALRWGVDYALYHNARLRQGYDASRPFDGTIRYATPQYRTDRQFINEARYAIAAARRVVGSPKSTAKPVRTASLSGVKMNLPHAYQDVIKAAIGL